MLPVLISLNSEINFADITIGRICIVLHVRENVRMDRGFIAENHGY